MLMDGGSQDAQRAAPLQAFQENLLVVAALDISGIATVPIVAAVAIDEPEVAANNVHAPMLECISPPGSH